MQVLYFSSQLLILSFKFNEFLDAFLIFFGQKRLHVSLHLFNLQSRFLFILFLEFSLSDLVVVAYF